MENKNAFLKKMSAHLTVPKEKQPLLCTHVRCPVTSKDSRAVLYTPRNDLGGSVVCHLGEVHLHQQARGELLDALEIEDKDSGSCF